MEWLAASIRPSLACLMAGHIRPGVSTSSMRSLRSYRPCCFVMAGSSPVSATRRLRSALISVDLPTLGMPITSMRKGFSGLSRCGASAPAMRVTLAASPGFLHDSATAVTPFSAPKARSQAAVASGSARSALLSTLRQGRCRLARSSAIIGLVLAPGRRASSTSMTTSVVAMVSAALRRAAVM